MTCLVKSKYKEELNHYKSILGSEEAAYYVLAMNNGNTLDQNPDGSTSSLYTALVEYYNGDEDQALLNMSVVFTPAYMGQHGDWTENFNSVTGSQEPSITTLQGEGLCDNSVISSMLQNDESISRFAILEQANELNRQAATEGVLKDYIEKKLEESEQWHKQQHPDATPNEVQEFLLQRRKDINEQLITDAIAKLSDYLKTNPDFSSTKEGQAFLQNLQEIVNNTGTVERQNQKIFALVNLVKAIINDEDLSTTPRELAEIYVRTFSDTDLMQSCFTEVAKYLNTTSSERMIRFISEYISNKMFDNSKQKRIKALDLFWGKFKNLFRKLFRRATVNYNEKWNLLDTVTTYFTCNKNLQGLTIEKINRDLGNLEVMGSSHQTNYKDVLNQIKKGLESRIKSIKSISNKQEINKEELITLQSMVDKIKDLQKLKGDPQDMEFIKSFIENGILEIGQTIRKLQDIHSRLVDEQKMVRHKNGKEIVITRTNNSPIGVNSTIQELLKLKTDIVGFYSSIVTKQLVPFIRTVDSPELQPGGVLYNSIQLINQNANLVQQQLDAEIERYAEYLVDIITERYVDIGNKERFKLNAKLWLKNKINNGDLAWFEKVIGSGISSQSHIVRMADFLIREVNFKVHQEAVKKSKELLRSYDESIPVLSRFSPSNFARTFCELDEKGRPTGNFVSDVNEGIANQKIKELVEKLNKKYKISNFTDTGAPVFDNDDQWHSYYDDYDRGLESLHIHRRYKADYYIAQRQFLSRDTVEEISRVQREIGKLYDKCYDDELKVPITENLSPKDKKQLQELLEYKRQLSNPYIMEKDEQTGKLTKIEEKTGDSARIAKEIRAWNKYKSKHISYKQNWDNFNKAYDKVKQKFGEDSIQARRFYFENVSKAISPNYYSEIENLFGMRPDDPVLTDLLARRSAIINACKIKRGYAQPNLDLLTPEAWQELKKLDEKISRQRKLQNSEKPSPQVMNAYVSLSTTYQVIKFGTNQPYIKWLEDNVSSQELEDKYYYVDADGTVKPLSVFTYNGPTSGDYIEDTLIGPFSELDLDSEWVDKDYDNTKEQALQPDKKVYHNPKYDELTDPNNKNYNKEIHDCYNLMLQMMEEAWQMLPGINRTNKYQLPQKRDRNTHLITRSGVIKNTEAILSNTFTINENDIEYNEEFPTRPDGSIVYTIPIRWVRRLEDPSTISTDLIQSISQFYEMALNYKMKSEIQPTLELLKSELQNTSSAGEYSDQAKRLDKYLEMYLYDRKKSGFRKNRKMGIYEQIFASSANIISKTAHSKLMPHNLNSILKNVIDSAFSLIAEIVGGRHFTYQDYWGATRMMWKEIKYNGGMFASVGRANKRSWIAQAMLYNNVHGSIAETFGGHNETWLRRVIENHFSMGEYTFVDYMFKGLITAMTYHTRRLIKNPMTGKEEFMTRQRAEWVYVQYKGNKKEGRDIWKHAKTTLADAYYVDKKGNFILKQEYVDIVTPTIGTSEKRSSKLETQVSTTISERASVINGMLDEMDKNGLSQNYIGAMILLMRGWMISQFVDYTKTGHDFAIYNSDDQHINKTSLRKRLWNNTLKSISDTSTGLILEEDEEYEGQYDFGTGIVEKGFWNGLLKAEWKWLTGGAWLRRLPLVGRGYEDLTDNQLYQIRRCHVCVTAVAILYSIGFANKILYESLLGGDDGDDDKDKLLKYLLFFNQGVSAASTSERFSQIPVIGALFTIVELVQTTTVATAWIKDLDKPMKALEDIIYMIGQLVGINDPITDGSDGAQPYQTVTQGSYKGYQRWVKDFAEAAAETPGINQFGVSNVIKKSTVEGWKQSTNWYAGTLGLTGYPLIRTNKTQNPNFWDILGGYDSEKFEADSKPKKSKSGQKKSKIKFV